MILQAKNARGWRKKNKIKLTNMGSEFCIIYSQLRELHLAQPTFHMKRSSKVALRPIQYICSFTCLFVREGQDLGWSTGEHSAGVLFLFDSQAWTDPGINTKFSVMWWIFQGQTSVNFLLWISFANEIIIRSRYVTMKEFPTYCPLTRFICPSIIKQIMQRVLLPTAAKLSSVIRV